jgi:transcription initiation factor TFIIE subunit beta
LLDAIERSLLLPSRVENKKKKETTEDETKKKPKPPPKSTAVAPRIDATK